jgi:nitrite reductase/ring-hydroxylating ferredoxin subunit
MSSDGGTRPGHVPGTGRVAGVRPAPRGTIDLDVRAGWWPIAFSNEVARHPKPFRLGSRNLAVYRDLSDTVRAVDDICPHRRLPLSMGRITEDGYLQCAYHGWCFDGATGKCTGIPHLRNDEKVPTGIRIAALATAENVAGTFGWNLRTPSLAPAAGPPTGEEPDEGTTMFDAHVAHGLVLVWAGGGEVAPTAPTLDVDNPRVAANWRTFSGSTELRAPHTRVSEAVIWNPGRLLGLGALTGYGEEVSGPDVSVVDGVLSVRRERLTIGLPRPSTFGALTRSVTASSIAMVPDTGLSWLTTTDDRGRTCARVTIGLTPLGRYRCVARWQASVSPRYLDRLVAARVERTVRKILGRNEAPGESAADHTVGIRDKAIAQLRLLRNDGGEVAVADIS